MSPAANPVGMGDWASVNRENRGAPGEAVVSAVPDEPEAVHNPTEEAQEPPAPLAEVAVPDAATVRGIDLTNPVAARAEGLDAPMAADAIAPPEMGFPALPIPKPSPILRFDPREWITMQGYQISANRRHPFYEVAAPDVVVTAKRATIGNILRDGFGRGVRSGSGNFVRTTDR